MALPLQRVNAGTTNRFVAKAGRASLHV